MSQFRLFFVSLFVAIVGLSAAHVAEAGYTKGQYVKDVSIFTFPTTHTFDGMFAQTLPEGTRFWSGGSIGRYECVAGPGGVLVYTPEGHPDWMYQDGCHNRVVVISYPAAPQQYADQGYSSGYTGITDNCFGLLNSAISAFGGYCNTGFFQPTVAIPVAFVPVNRGRGGGRGGVNVNVNVNNNNNNTNNNGGGNFHNPRPQPNPGPTPCPPGFFSQAPVQFPGHDGQIGFTADGTPVGKVKNGNIPGFLDNKQPQQSQSGMFAANAQQPAGNQTRGNRGKQNQPGFNQSTGFAQNGKVSSTSQRASYAPRTTASNMRTPLVRQNFRPMAHGHPTMTSRPQAAPRRAPARMASAPRGGKRG